MVKVVLALLGLYLLLIVCMALAQTRLLFPVRMAAAGDIELPQRAREVDFTATDGTRLHGIHIPALRSKASSAALLLGFGGNAWNGETLAAFLSTHVPDHDVLVFHYRGYAPSQGNPSAAALMQDAIAVHDFALNTIRPSRLITIGLSIGSGPAVYLAHRRRLAGTILITPFDSLKSLAGDHYWWAPVALMLRHQMQIAELAAEVDSPIAIIAAGQDKIVPPRRTDALRRSIRYPGLDRTIADAGHNDIYNHPEFAIALREAISLIETKASLLNGAVVTWAS